MIDKFSKKYKRIKIIAYNTRIYNVNKFVN
jgi:hypothetical protein